MLWNKIIKIGNDLKSRWRRDHSNSIKAYLSQKNIQPCILEDNNIQELASKNNIKIRFHQEIRKLYSERHKLSNVLKEKKLKKSRLQLGHSFRHCYNKAINEGHISHPAWVSETKECKQSSDTSVGMLENNDVQQSQVAKLQSETHENTDHHIEFDIPELTEEWKEIHQKHLIESLQAYQYLNDIEPPKEPLKLEESDKFTKKDDRKLLIFDMDETLIHCIWEPDENTQTDIKIPIESSEGIYYKHVNLRPYVVEWLLELSKMYYIIVFTASTQDYADPILNYLEKDYKLIQNRFYRHHCHRTKDKVTIKDLRIFEQWGYEMKDIILVDNATHWFGFQVENGIPMVPFIDK